MSEGESVDWLVEISQLIDSVRDAIVDATRQDLVGIYLSGSYVGSDFDPDVSDIDLIAVLNSGVSQETAVALQQIHNQLEGSYPPWKDRIEVIYVGASDLREFRTSHGHIAVISPGEPFHVIELSADWVLSWYPARLDARPLVGPPVSEVIPVIHEAEYIAALRDQLLRFRPRIDSTSTPGSQAYAVLSMCRGLRTLRYRDRLSKAQAAAWAEAEFPQWAGLIHEAIVWRSHQWEHPQADGTDNFPRVQRFVADMLSEANLLPD